jgi:hypothetical protein
MHKKQLQRIIYLMSLVLYLMLWFINENYKILLSMSSFGIAYWIIDLVIIVPLLFQLIFNNKIGWFCILLLLLVHFVFAIKNAIGSFETPTSNTMIVILIYLLPFALIYYLYPAKNK